MALSTEVKRAIDSLLQKTSLQHLKPKQEEILESILNGKDCLAILPTGYGKSLPLQLYIPTKKAVGKSVNRVVVCCPLVSLMEDQVERIKQFGVTAALRGKDKETDALIESSQIEVIFASPESLCEEWVDSLRDVTLIVVDECHTIPTWGGLDGDEEKAFRKYFRYIGRLRSFYPEAAVLALSATCTLKMKKQIIDILNMKISKCIEISPNKKNIKYVVKRIPTEIEATFFWLVEKLNQLKQKFPRTLIYCNSIQDVCKLYQYLVTETGLSSECIIDMYHSETTSQKKDLIVKNLVTESNLRIVITTSALGMGIDVSECQCVILYGPPKLIVDLIQESGRCGRNGEDSVCIIMCNRYQLSHLSQDVKDVIKCTDCRRVSILKNITSEKIDEGNHKCCDLCASKCNCGSCTIHNMEQFVADCSVEDEDSDNEVSESSTISYEYESDDIDSPD